MDPDKARSKRIALLDLQWDLEDAAERAENLGYPSKAVECIRMAHEFALQETKKFEESLKAGREE